MSKKANPTFIGAFVLIALAVAIAAIMTLGNFSFKEKSVRCVAYFSGSLHGLDVGAPVAFRGVSIGRVSGIQLDYDEKNDTVVIPVYMELRQDFNSQSGLEGDVDEMRESIKTLIGRGLKAQMQASSLLTGKQYVELSLKPEKTPTLHGGAPQDVLEIPTVSSGLDKITETLEKLPLEDILAKVAKSLDSINSAVSSGKAGETVQHLMASVDKLESVLTTLNQNLPKIMAEVNQGMGSFAATMQETNSFVKDAHKDLKPASQDLRKIMASVQDSTEKLNRTLNNLERLTASDSDVSYQLRDTMREMERAAKSVNELVDFLRQNPNALLFGKGKDK